MRLSSNHISPSETNVDIMSAFGVFTRTDGGILSLKTGALREDLAAEIQNTAARKLAVSLSVGKKLHIKNRKAHSISEKSRFFSLHQDSNNVAMFLNRSRPTNESLFFSELNRIAYAFLPG